MLVNFYYISSNKVGFSLTIITRAVCRRNSRLKRCHIQFVGGNTGQHKACWTKRSLWSALCVCCSVSSAKQRPCVPTSFHVYEALLYWNKTKGHPHTPPPTHTLMCAVIIWSVLCKSVLIFKALFPRYLLKGMPTFVYLN